MTVIETDRDYQTSGPGSWPERKARRRVFTYIITGAALVLCYLLLRGMVWQGNAALHTMMEVVATGLALAVGIIALVRFYSKKDNTFLFIGSGFLGTAFLDGYHAVVTSAAFQPLMPSDLPALIPWSWIASRQFLSFFLFLSWLAWAYKQRFGARGQVDEKSIYLFTATTTLISFMFFAFTPLPRAYYPELPFHRPEEFLPALFFLAALAGYLRKGDWRHDILEHWIVLSLIVSFVSQAVFMSFSGTLFDMEFDAAHLLKKISYICVFIGLLGSIYIAFRQEAQYGEIMVRARDKAEAALAELASHKLVLDEHSIVVVTDTFGTITYANDKFCEISKYDREEIIGANHRLIKSGHHPKSFFENLYRTIKKGEVWHGEVKNRAKDGSHYWVDTTIAPFKDANGKIIQFVAVRTDITARKNTIRDLADSNKNLQRANADLKRFAYIASHDLQEPLRKLQQFSDFMAKDCSDELSDDGKYFLDVINRSSARMSHLIRDLLTYSRTTNRDFDPVEVNLADAVSAILSEFELLASETKASFHVGDLPSITADRTAVEHLVRNLIGNAIKYNHPERDPVIEISTGSPHGNGAVELHFTDNGIGFDMQFSESIFEPFRRLHNKHEYSGSGIGLAVCNTICERHGWKLHAISEQGKGSTFSVIIPLPESV